MFSEQKKRQQQRGRGELWLKQRALVRLKRQRARGSVFHVIMYFSRLPWAAAHGMEVMF